MPGDTFNPILKLRESSGQGGRDKEWDKKGKNIQEAPRLASEVSKIKC